MTARAVRVLVAAAVAALSGGCSHRLLRPIGPLPIQPLPGRRQIARESENAADKVPPDVARARHKWYARPNGRTWRHIVIHHSASDSGSAARFDRYHRLHRGWDELGYHFVIDNGHGGPDGNVEVGSRWKKQKHGAHAGGTPGNEYNEHGIGICLVGRFGWQMPSRAQMASLNDLLGYLTRTHRIAPENVIGHRDAPGAKTTCPGDRLHRYISRTLRPKLRRALAAPAGAAARRP